ncbi:MAG TPA: FecR domain-containing protein [Polyangiales bacterium]|nr:FecR domain-containing protein [Polyangiales bacterium]
MHRPTPSGGVPNLRHAAGQQSSASSQLAEALRQTPVQLPEMHRARLERNLVEAWRARGAHAVPLPRARLGLSRAVWVGSIAASAALGVALGFAVLRHPEASAPAQAAQAAGNVAHFDLVIGDGAVQSGTLVAGQVLESGKHGHIEVSLALSRVDIAPDSRVRFEKLDNDELRLSLVQGRVDVAFHPEHKGQQRLSVETSAARVVVVGTQFAVETTANRETRVSVSEGVVRVEPRRGGQALLVHAGEQTTVGAEREQQLSQLSKAPHATIEPSQLAAPRSLPIAREVSEKARSGRARGRKAKVEDRAGSDYDTKLENARQLLLQGKHAAAREKLQRMTEGSVPASTRVEALVLTAESYTAQGQVPRAAAAYRQAVEAAPREPAGHNALFALARLLDRYTEDNESAASAYREYLAKAPHGALARQARDALCRLTPCQ